MNDYFVKILKKEGKIQKIPGLKNFVLRLDQKPFNYFQIQVSINKSVKDKENILNEIYEKCL